MTTITEVNAHPIAVSLKQMLWTAHEQLKDATVVLVEVRTSGGLAGFGQISSAPMKEVSNWLERLGNVARGMNALSQVEVWQRLFALTSPRPGGVAARDGSPPPLPRAARPQIMAAIGGIDIALWDIKGKAAGMPAYRLLGAEKRPIFTYGTGGYYVPGAPLTAYAEELAGFVAKGYRGVKLTTGAETVADEAARIRSVRDAIGPGVLLMLDMNVAYDLETCIGFARAVEPFDQFWLEDHCIGICNRRILPDSPRQHRFHLPTASASFTGSPCAISSPKVQSVAFSSIRPLRRFHRISAHRSSRRSTRGVRITPHHAPELHAHLVAAFPEAGFGVESHGDDARDPIWHGQFKKRAEVRDSYVHLNDDPGFGIEIDWTFVDKHRVR